MWKLALVHKLSKRSWLRIGANFLSLLIIQSLITFDFADWAVFLLSAHIVSPQGYHMLLTISIAPTESGPLGYHSNLAPNYDFCIYLASGSEHSSITLVSPSSLLLVIDQALWLPLLLSTLGCIWPAHKVLSGADALSQYMPHGLGKQYVPWAFLCNIILHWIIWPLISNSLSRVHSEPSNHCLSWQFSHFYPI